MLTTGLNLIRDLHASALTKVQLGTSGAAVLVSQTGLLAAVSGSSGTPTITQSGQANQIAYTLSSSTGTGNSYREMTVMNASGTSYDRNVFPTFIHDGTNALIVNKSYFYTQQ